MIIVAFDIGSVASGAAVLRRDADRIKLIGAEFYRYNSKKYSFTRRVWQFYTHSRDLIEEISPDHVALEMCYFNKGAPNLASMGKVAIGVGAGIIASEGLGHKPIMMAASTVRSRLGKLKNKEELRSLINSYFKQDLRELGYEKGVTSNKKDLSDAIGLGWAAFTEVPL